MAGRPIHTFEVVRTEQLTPHLIRGGAGGRGFDTFIPNEFTDAYVKIVIVNPDIDVASLPKPLTMDGFSALPSGKRPTVRTYTVRHVDSERREVCIDFLVQGERGVAGPWAVSAVPGQPAYLMAPSGAYAPTPLRTRVSWPATKQPVPAISAALEAVPDNAIGRVFIEVAGPEYEIALKKPDGFEVRWIYRGGGADLAPEDQAGDHAPLIDTLKETPWLAGQVQGFIHGEAQTVRRRR